MQLRDTLGIMRNVTELQRNVVKSSYRRIMKYDPFRSSDESIPVYRNSLIKIRPSKHIICDHKV